MDDTVAIYEQCCAEAGVPPDSAEWLAAADLGGVVPDALLEYVEATA